MSSPAPRPPRPPKGHRQRGAGTVVVAKASVKRDGLEMKEWQKSPKQLLLAYCQAESRPAPKYVPSSTLSKDKVLYRVILPDAKQQKEKDLTFVPKDVCFDDQIEAEHAVALLALAKLDGARSHELKLPEPYKTAFLNLVGRKAEVASDSAQSSSSAAASEAYVCPTCNKSFAKPHALEHHQKKEHPRSSSQTPPPPPPAPAPAPAPLPTAAPVKREEKVIKPQAETLLNLQASSKFTSVAERKMAEEERARAENKRNSNINLNAHNVDEVFMSEENRILVEQIVREAKECLEQDGEVEMEVEVGVDALVRRIAKLGFGETDARAAFTLGKARDLDSALDWLLLNVNESSLPTSFDPRGMQLGVIKNATPAPAPSSQAQPSAQQQQPLQYPGKNASLATIRAWLDAEQPVNAELADGGDDELEDWDTLVAILGEENVSKTESGVIKLRVGVNPELHESEELVVELYPPTSRRQFLIRGLSNDDLARKATQQLARDMQRQLLPGEACAYFLWDHCRSMPRPSLLNLKSDNKAPSRAAAAAATTQGTTTRPERARQVKTLSKEEIDKQSAELLKHLERRPVMASRSHLPASAHRDTIIECVTNHQVVILKGETGCGKTTQVPQFILEHLIATGQGGTANIIVTQPRRLAAISVAQRVSEEFGGNLGEEIGYRVQLESRYHPKLTRLEFCTTGLLLRRLEFEGDALPVTHIFVDEIHERSLDSDFLLAMLKHQVLPKRPNVRIVLMSATMDAARFSAYFADRATGAPAPVLEIPGRTFPVEDLFLEDLPVERNYELDIFSFTAQCIKRAHEVTQADGSILVFVSGVNEINRTIAACGQCDDLLLLGLHGNSPTGQNQAVFARAPRGKRKVVVCTNVCETSITIPDCVVVIDTGRAKEIRYDGENKFSRLEEDWISLANARQRRGRAGRVRAGVCWKLFSKNKELAPDQTAEVHRVPLDNIVLSVAHHLRNDASADLAGFFNTLIEPPSVVNVRSAIETLVEINAIDAKTQRLTPLGQHLVKLPMDAQLGKLLIYGSLLAVPRELAIATASLCRSKSMFLPEQSDRKYFERGSQSDHLANIYAFEEWEKEQGAARRKEFCQKHGLDANVLREISSLVTEFLGNLDRIGFASKSAVGALSEMSRRKRIKACLCVLSPSVLRIRKPQKRYVQMSGGAMETEDYDSREIRFFPLRQHGKDEQQQQRVFIHPSSVNQSCTTFYSNFLVYSSLMKTSKLFARDCTCVSPYGLILFASTQVVVSHERSALICDEGKMTFKCSARVGVLLKEIKKLLDELLQAKIEEGGKDTSQLTLAVMDACTKLVDGDGFS